MFSGIIEERAQLIHSQTGMNSVRITLTRPLSFRDLKPGDSVCVNGVCLTVTKCNEAEMNFDIGFETLKITKWQHRMGQSYHVEQSLRIGDRVHGHFVTGHVES